MATLMPFLSFAQVTETSPVFYNIDVSQGLAGNSLYHVICDRRGRIWAGTNRGISCYDGGRFINYTTKDGLIENKAIKLFEDSKGRIWCMGYEPQLGYFEEGVFHGYRYNQTLKDSVNPKATLLNFAISKEDEVFIVFQNYKNRLVHIDANGNLDFGNEEVKERCIRLVEVDHKVLVHLAEEPKWSLSKESLKDRFIIGKDWEQPMGLACSTETGLNQKKRMETALRLQDGRLLVNTRRGLFGQLSINGPIEMIASKRDITDLYQDHTGLIWEGHFRKGLYIYHPEDLQNPIFHWLPGHGIAGITADREGGIWVGTGSRGLYYVPNRKVIREKKKDVKVLRRLIDNTGNQLVNRIGVGYVFQGVNGKKLENLGKFLGSRTTHSMMPQNGEFLALGADNGVYILDPDDGTPIKVWDHYIASLVNGDAVCDSAVYFRSAGGIVKVSQEGKVDSIHITRRFTGAVGTSDTHWFLNDFTGLYEYDRGVISKLYPREGNLEIKFGFMMGDTLISATQGEGILITTPDTAYTIGTEKGLPSDFVNSVLKLSGNRIGVATDKGFVVTKLPFDRTKMVFLNGRNSLNRTNLFGVILERDTIHLYNKEERYLIAEADIEGNHTGLLEPVLYGYLNDSLIIDGTTSGSYYQNNASFSFNAVSLQNQPQYRYQLIGHEDNWVETEQGEAYFGKLQPGSYTFRLQARPKYSEWPNLVTELSFKIRPPFWWTWWFIGLIFLIVAGGGYLLFRWYIKRIRRQALAKQKMLALKNEALRSQMNPHFTFNALNSIQSYITVNDKTSAANFLSDFAAMMRSFLEHSRQDFICLEDEKALLHRYLDLEQLRFPGQFDFRIEIGHDLEEDMDEIPAMLVQPLVENAIIHGVQASKATKLIVIRFERISDTLLRCLVLNDGIQLEMPSKAKPHKSLGLKILRERLANLEAAGMGRGTLRIFPAPEIVDWKTGVCAQLDLPYRHGS